MKIVLYIKESAAPPPPLDLSIPSLVQSILSLSLAHSLTLSKCVQLPLETHEDEKAELACHVPVTCVAHSTTSKCEAPSYSGNILSALPIIITIISTYDVMCVGHRRKTM